MQRSRKQTISIQIDKASPSYDSQILRMKKKKKINEKSSKLENGIIYENEKVEFIARNLRTDLE